MDIRQDLYMRAADKKQLPGNAPVDLWMRQHHKCNASKVVYAMELGNGLIVCPGCKHGPCEVPQGIEHGRELHIHKEPK